MSHTSGRTTSKEEDHEGRGGEEMDWVLALVLAAAVASIVA
jgi:hypothetical protein